MVEPWELTVELTNDKVGFTGISQVHSDRPIASDFPLPWEMSRVTALNFR